MLCPLIAIDNVPPIDLKHTPLRHLTYKRTVTVVVVREIIKVLRVSLTTVGFWGDTTIKGKGWCWVAL